MTTLIAGIVALGGETGAGARLNAMLAAFNPQRRSESRTVLSAGQAHFGAITLGPGDEPPSILERNGTLFVADVTVWDGTPGGRSDPEALAALDREGPGALTRLNGDFVWARWDGGTLTVGRDHFGARPIFITVRPGAWIAFASTPAALLETGLASHRLHRPSLGDRTGLAVPPLGRSFWEDIRAPRPAHVTTITPTGQQREDRYWRLAAGPRIAESGEPAEAEAELRRLLVQAVERRLPASGPGGAHLSGGIDSTPVAVIAARALKAEGRALHGYAFVEDPGAADFEFIDEGPYVDETVAMEPVIDLVRIGKPGVTDRLFRDADLSLFAWTYPEEPEQQILRHASANGVGTVLSGWGGDEVASYAGSAVLPELLRHGQWARFREERPDERLRATLYYRLLLPMLGERTRRMVTRLTGRQSALDRQVAQQVPLFYRPDFTPYDDPPMPPDAHSALIRRWLSELAWVPHRLALFQLLGAPWGVRYAYPYLDLDLVAHAMRMGAWFWARGGGFREAHRGAIRGLVPESVRLREAKLFAFPLCALRLSHRRDELLHRLAAIPRDGTAAQVFDIDALARAVERDLEPPEAVRDRIREAAQAGQQYRSPVFDCIQQVQTALILGQYDQAHGT